MPTVKDNHSGQTLAATSFPITPGSALQRAPCKGVFVGVAGNVAFTDSAGNTDTWTCPAGFIIPVMINSVQSSGTTASDLHELH